MFRQLICLVRKKDKAGLKKTPSRSEYAYVKDMKPGGLGGTFPIRATEAGRRLCMADPRRVICCIQLQLVSAVLSFEHRNAEEVIVLTSGPRALTKRSNTPSSNKTPAISTISGEQGSTQPLFAQKERELGSFMPDGTTRVVQPE